MQKKLDKWKIRAFLKLCCMRREPVYTIHIVGVEEMQVQIIPLVIIKDLDTNLVNRWNEYYCKSVDGRDRTVEESLWRRTQLAENYETSGWKSSEDARRRMVHYRHRYGLLNHADGSVDLALTETYIWLHCCFPEPEILEYQADIWAALIQGQWTATGSYDHANVSHRVWVNQGLTLKLSRMKKHPEDVSCQRTLPPTYSVLEMTLTSDDSVVNDEIARRPWQILKTGIRTPDRRGKPHLDPLLTCIDEYLPAHIELGCGPSAEAGVPPLHSLHQIYYVTDRQSQKFILGAGSDKLAFEIAASPLKKLTECTAMFKSCFLAMPTSFHHTLKLLYERGLIVGPIITNNFDGLPARLGLPELYVRRFEETHLVPSIPFSPASRSLIVVGSHADRRKTIASARMAGLKILFIDPEGYWEDGTFHEYSLESPQDGDILCSDTASNAFANIMNRLLEQRRNNFS